MVQFFGPSPYIYTHATLKQWYKHFINTITQLTTVKSISNVKNVKTDFTMSLKVATSTGKYATFTSKMDNNNKIKARNWLWTNHELCPEQLQSKMRSQHQLCCMLLPSPWTLPLMNSSGSPMYLKQHFGHAIRHNCFGNDMIRATLSESRKRGKPKIMQLKNITDWIKINLARLLWATKTRNKWKRTVHSVVRTRMHEHKTRHGHFSAYVFHSNSI